MKRPDVLADRSADELDDLILSEFPYPIAVNYRKMLETTDWDRRTRQCIEVFEYGLRAMTLGVLSEYLIRDVDKVRDPELDRKLHDGKLSKASLGQWNEFFFLTVRAYGGQRDLFFVPELYDLYWDTSQEPHRPRKGLRGPFERLVQIRNDLAHRLPPNTDAGWEALGTEVLDLLHKVLGHFSFLQHYDLIRIVAKQGEEYEYERYTGQEITTHCEPLQGNGGLHDGWFYLRRDDKAVLNLHPLFVLWPNSPETLSDDMPRDAAVLERLLKETVEYVATVVREIVKSDDAELLAQFRELIYYNLEHIKLGQAQTPLSWDSLRQAAGKLTQDKTGAIQVRYQRALYLQRDEAFRKFRDFLASDKACFVLTGNSGVGKSNFVLSLADELAQRDDACLLIYNAARLEIAATATQTITQDLGQYLSLSWAAGHDLLAELDRNELMVGRQLIVVFDAVNESTDPKALLQKIDQLVGGNRYPWLKVLITSRPQSWWNMKRGLQLAVDRYYQDQDSDTLWVELREFTVKLEPFARQELPQVYQRYRQTFQLQTPYNELSIHLRQALQDPLILRLVSESYTGQSIPEHIQVGEIYGKYIATLQKSGRLYPEDLILLERELMPLMMFSDHYENQVTAAQISAARTSDGRPLWELIFSGDLLSNSQRVNASFDRLVDVGILLRPEAGPDSIIGFTYERFYEYFAGRRIFELGPTPADRLSYYNQIIAELRQKLYLWGALVQALHTELVKDKDNTQLFLELAPSSAKQPLLRSAMTAALTQFGENDFAKAKDLIEKLIGPLPPGPGNFFTALQRMLRPVQDEVPEVPVQQLIALEAASNLELVDILADVSAAPSPNLRGAAALQTFHLWLRNPQAGLQVFDELGKRVSCHRVPDVPSAESMLALTAAILGYIYGQEPDAKEINRQQDTKTVLRLLRTGRMALRKVLLLGSLDQQSNTAAGRAFKATRGFLYGQVVNAIARYATGILERLGDFSWFTIPSFQHVFGLPEEQKALLRSLVPFLDPTVPGLADRLQDVLAIEDSGDAFGQILAELIMLSHGYVDFEGTFELVKEMTVFALRSEPPKFWVGGPGFNLWQGGRRQRKKSKEFLDLTERTVIAVQKDSTAWAERAHKDRAVALVSDHRAAWVGQYVGVYYDMYGSAPPPLVTQWLERAQHANDQDYLDLYIRSELTLLFQLGMLRTAILAAKPVAESTSTKVQTSLIEFLVTARRHSPDLVEDLLYQEEFPESIINQVLASPPSEGLINLVTYQLTGVVYDLFILGPEPLREELQWFMYQALKLPSFEVWVSTLVKELSNMVAGELIFSVPEDAPSRRYAGIPIPNEVADG